MFTLDDDDKVIVEAELVGDEVEVGVLERPDGTVTASVPAKLNGTADSDEGFYGFETKYLDDRAQYTVPANLTEEQAATLKALAAALKDALA